MTTFTYSVSVDGEIRSGEIDADSIPDAREKVARMYAGVAPGNVSVSGKAPRSAGHSVPWRKPGMREKAKLCPYCAEKIKATAIKCKHCGEFLQEPRSSGQELPSIAEDLPDGDQTPGIRRPLGHGRKRGMKYVLAILACAGLFILYAVLGAAVFGWEHGGGAIPMLVLIAAIVASWRAITKSREPEGGDQCLGAKSAPPASTPPEFADLVEAWPEVGQCLRDVSALASRDRRQHDALAAYYRRKSDDWIHRHLVKNRGVFRAAYGLLAMEALSRGLDLRGVHPQVPLSRLSER